MTLLEAFPILIGAVVVVWALFAVLGRTNDLETDYLSERHVHAPRVDAWKDDTQ